MRVFSAAAFSTLEGLALGFAFLGVKGWGGVLSIRASTSSRVKDLGMADIPIHVSSLPEAKILSDLESVANDLRLVREIVQRLAGLINPAAKDEPVMKALFSAGLITYRRCFNTGIRNGLTRADIEAIPDKAIGLHEYLHVQANKLIAHSVKREPSRLGLEHRPVENQLTTAARYVMYIIAESSPDLLMSREIWRIVHEDPRRRRLRSQKAAGNR